MSSAIDRVRRSYAAVAVLLLNCLVVFLVLNALAGGVLAAQAWQERRRLATGQLPAHQRHVDLDAYGSADPATGRDILDEFTLLRQRGFAYRPWMQFSEPRFSGRHLNVEDRNGDDVRRTPWEAPGDGRRVVDVFAFGGSTTFGYNVADDSTVAAHLQPALQARLREGSGDAVVRVTNHGHGYFYSSQEAVLFLALLRKGQRPAVSVFLDGLNDVGSARLWGDMPAFTTLTEDLWSAAQTGDVAARGWLGFERLPLFRLLVQRETRSPEGVSPALSTRSRRSVDVASEALRTYRANVRAIQAICKEYDVECHFFVQPVPYYSRAPPGGGESDGTEAEQVFRKVYGALEQDPGPSVFLGHLIHEYGASRKIFVDDVHYGPEFAQFLAARMAREVTPDAGRDRSRAPQGSYTSAPRSHPLP